MNVIFYNEWENEWTEEMWPLRLKVKFFILINPLIKLLLWFTSTNFIVFFFLWALSKVFYNTPSVCLNSFSYKGIASSQYKNVFLLIRSEKKCHFKKIFSSKKRRYMTSTFLNPLMILFIGLIQVVTFSFSNCCFLCLLGFVGVLVTPHSPTSLFATSQCPWLVTSPFDL